MHSQGNILSLLAFFIWIPIALWGARRWPPAKAAALLLVLPLMFLPEVVSFKIPGLPSFSKGQVAVFWLLVGALVYHRDRLGSVRLNNWIKFAMVLLLGGHVVTVLLNSDPVVFGSVYRSGHRPYEAFHLLVRTATDHIIPFALGVAMFNGPKDLRVFFRVLVGAVLVYSVFQLIELRLSPQFHNWVYGFFQHSFSQTKRGGGYRPTVFMVHGLAVAMFTMAGVLASAGLYKAKIKAFRIGAVWILAYLWLILLLSKSLAAFLYSLVAVPLIVLVSPKVQFRAAALLALVVLLYPIARGAGLIPVEEITDWVGAEFGEKKVGSITTRFVNEELLFERARERAFFGWGKYGRASIYEATTGKEIAVLDGDWIITWGQYGRVGFFGKYLLLLLPIFLSLRQLKYVRRKSDRRLLAALALIIAFSVFDLLPNGNFNYLVFVFSGVLMGCSTGIVRHEAQQARLRRERAIARRSLEISPDRGARSMA